MRYMGGLLGGIAPALLLSDLGNGQFDGAWLIQNFENLKPEAQWEKYANLFLNVDHEQDRFLEFERWWNGFYFLSREEIVRLEHQRQLANAYMVVATRLAGDVRFQQIQSARGPQANPRQVESDFENDPEAIQLTGYLGGGGQGLYFAGGLQPRDILERPKVFWTAVGVSRIVDHIRSNVNPLSPQRLGIR